jgi:predicted Na+-dependent transporter
MSATVDVSHLKQQVTNFRAIGIGLFIQFLVLPLFGYTIVKTLNLDHATGIILLVITSSPGGSYSNWWCSMFNADLALSVTMTAISTCLSVVLLPLNLLMYAHHAYGEDLLADALDWRSVAVALVLVISAIVTGLTASAKFNSHRFNLNANRLGNFAGVILITFSFILSSSSQEARLWNRDWTFYLGVSLPCLFGLFISNVITALLNINKPERVTICIESCYQNVGIATSVAISMFNGEDQALAIAVPFYYGFTQVLLALTYATTAWKLGWTKAPANVSFWHMLATSYEILTIEEEEGRPHKETDGFYYVDHAEVDEEAGKQQQESSTTKPDP